MKLARPSIAFGYAGLIPPLLAIAAFFFGPAGWRPYAWQAGVVYALVIFGFLGGTWWSFALRADPRRQVTLLALSVLPPLGAAVLFLVMSPAWALLLAGLHVAILPVDRLFERLALAPEGWLRLRASLATGLALATTALAIAGLRMMGG